MVTHSSVLAWRVPWTAEPGGLRPMGSQTRLSNTSTHTHNLQYFYLDKINQGKIEHPVIYQLILHCGVDTQGSSFESTE